MEENEIKKILSNFKTIAVIGISPKEDRPSYRVASYLQSKGYRIIPVRPDGEEILGEKVYPTLSNIPKEINVEVVDIFRKSEDLQIRSIAIPLLGVHYGFLKAERFIELLGQALKRTSLQHLKRLWLIVPGGTARDIVGMLKAKLEQQQL